jgi:hypothetical protein
MTQLNPYESPRPLNFQPPSTLLQGAGRLTRSAVLGAVGYCVYFASVFVFSRMDSSITWEAGQLDSGRCCRLFVCIVGDLLRRPVGTTHVFAPAIDAFYHGNDC